MNTKYYAAYHALQKVAKQENLSLASITESIEEAIHFAYHKALREGDPAVLSVWAEIPRKGPLPTAPEFIAYLTDRITR